MTDGNNLPNWAKNKVAYNVAYNKKKYDIISYRVMKGEKEIIRKHAAQQGQSINEFIDSCVLDNCPSLQRRRKV